MLTLNKTLTPIKTIEPGKFRWSNMVNIQPHNQIAATHVLFSQSKISDQLAEDIYGSLRQFKINEDSAIETILPIKEQLENTLVHGCWHGERSKVIFEDSPELANHLITVETYMNAGFLKMKIEGPCPRDLDFRKHRVKRHFSQGQLGMWGEGLTSIFTDGFKRRTKWISSREKVSIVEIKKGDPKRYPPKRSKIDYFMGTWEVLSTSDSIYYPFKYILPCLYKMKYNHQATEKIKFSLVGGMHNALYHGHWHNKRDEALVRKHHPDSLDKVISISWRINASYAQFLISDSGPGFDPLEIIDRKRSRPDKNSTDSTGLDKMQKLMDEISFSFPTDNNGKIQGTQLILGKSNKK